MFMLARSHLATVRFMLVTVVCFTSLSSYVYSQQSFRAINVSTQPKAVVWVDGIRFGRADESGRLEITTISPGAHSIRVRADGFKEKIQPLTAAIIFT